MTPHGIDCLFFLFCMTCFDLFKLAAAERKLAEMEGALQVVDQEIGGLEERQADLLRQLKLIQEQSCAAKAKRVQYRLTPSTPCDTVTPQVTATNQLADAVYIDLCIDLDKE